MVTVTKEQIENIVQLIDGNATDLWTFVTGGMSGASTWMVKTNNASAAQYESLGRSMADQAASLSRTLANLADGGGSTEERAFLNETARAMSARIEELRVGGASAYANYGKAIAEAAANERFMRGVAGASAIVDGLTLATSISEAQRTGNWAPVAGTLGSIVGTLGAGSPAAAAASIMAGALIPVVGVSAAIPLVLAVSGVVSVLGGKAGELTGLAIGNLLLGQNPLPDIDAFFKQFGLALNLVDPLVLDLNGDGIHTIGASASTAYFDFDGQGSRIHTGWISADDGFLVLDRNGNGHIDSGAELFSNFTPLANGALAPNGFDALKEFDVNKDGVIDSKDAIWSSLKVWRDANVDGRSEQGELVSLDALGIVAIRLSRDGTIRTLDDGNVVRATGSFIQIVDGVQVERTMQEVWFGQDTLHQRFDDVVPLREDVTSMAFVQGAGNVRDLWQAASLNTAAGAALRDVLGQLMSARTAEAQHALIEPLLRAWAATSNMATTQTLMASGKRTATGLATDPPWLDRLSVLEKMSGTMLGARSDGLVALSGTRGDYVKDAWSTLTDSVYVAIAMQSRWKPYLDAITYTIDANGYPCEKFDGLLAGVMSAEARVGAQEVAVLLAEFTRTFGEAWWHAGFDVRAQLHDYVEGHQSQDVLRGLAASGVIFGSGTLAGSAGRDFLLGSIGNDRLEGGEGDDLLDGGAGNDTLVGGRGSDTYVFGRNSGNDTIYEEYDAYGSDTDAVRFDANIHPQDVTVRRDGTSDDLLVTVAGSSNVLRIRNQLTQSGASFVYGVEQFRFADGTVWDKQAVALMTLRSTPGNDVLVGFSGDDLMDGGAGNDTLYGGRGSDTYVFGRNSGNDTIYEEYDANGKDTDVVQFDADIRPQDVTVRRDGTSDDLLVTVVGSSNVLRIRNQLTQSGASFVYGVEQFRFADGTVWDKQAVALMTLRSTPGNDVLVGFSGDDLMDGGAGNDTLYGGRGSDTYVFGRNSGNDTIYEEYDANGKDTDVVQFDADIRPQDVTVKRDGTSDDLLVTVVGSSNVLRIRNQLTQSGASFVYGVEQFRFADGTVWDKQAVALMTLRSTPGNDVLVGFSGDDLMDGGAGNDTLYGGRGSDTYVFGRNSGNDTIYEEYDANGKDTDVVQFDADIRPQDVTVKRDGTSDDLLVT
ncbi:calcium-binding protein, partial [Paraburkholderia solisilvae]